MPAGLKNVAIAKLILVKTYTFVPRYENRF